jgi:hypothetical protein
VQGIEQLHSYPSFFPGAASPRSTTLQTTSFIDDSQGNAALLRDEGGSYTLQYACFFIVPSFYLKQANIRVFYNSRVESQKVVFKTNAPFVEKPSLLLYASGVVRPSK